jgi:predicted dehydrogenase
MGIGLLATGQIIPAFAKSKYAKPVAFITGHPEKNMEKAKSLGIDPKNVYTYDTYDSIKDNPEIDVVYNVLPNAMHPEYTIRGAKAGKHILCEKPMATNVADCQAMIDACKAAGKKLMIAYRMQYEPMTRKFIELTRSSIGDLKSITTEASFTMGAANTPDNYWRLNKKMAGGGPLMDMGIYGLQAARYLSGQEPSRVTAISFQPANNPQFSQVEQTMSISLEFPSGLVATILTSYGFSCNRARAYGVRGAVEMEPLQAYANNHLWQGRGADRQEVKVDPANHFATEMDAFCLSIMNNQPILTPGEEGLRDMKIITAAFESARTGKSVTLV